MRRAEVIVRSRVLEALEDLALESYPSEAIASLHGYAITIRDSKVRVVVSLAAKTYIVGSTATPLSINFRLDPASLLNPSWVGIWHSHPQGEGELSPQDLETVRSLANAKGGFVVAGVTAVRKEGFRIVYSHVFKLIDSGGSLLGESRWRRVRSLH